MRVERLTYNKIKIFLTFDDLNERGISKEEIWQDIPKVHQLFRDMMTEADDEVGFKADGPIAVEVFSLPAQGMVVIVTKGVNEYEIEEDYDEDYIEMQVTLDESDEVFYEFLSFEDVISLGRRLSGAGLAGGTLFSYNDRFYLKFEEDEVTGVEYDMLIALLAEFGCSSTITSYRVMEYGKKLMANDAIKQIVHFFK
ncbi:genetic competence negative regulator [Fictibacillus iocasae]|uniref:Adapter protein MecA n=1 Tax=Fictibacillus iocasae TaxID=2715437 RepID=A0ABW2NM43_9BACL